MKAIRRLISNINELEQQFACDIAKVAAELEPLPNDRDTTTLEGAWVKATSSRRKLANCIKQGLRHIEQTTVTERIVLRRFKNARKELKAAKTRLRIWGRVDSIVSAQLLSEPRGLLEKDLASTHKARVMDQVVDLFLASMHRVANPTSATQGADAKNHGCHRDIPYPIWWFSKMIGAAHRICLALRRQRPLRFLDVGSGGGTKVLAATTCFDVCDGLEYDTSTVNTGRQFLDLLAPGRCKMIHGDALEFLDYGEYDVIYFYRPLRGKHRMDAMEERVFDQARPGTVVIAAGGLSTDDPHSKGIHKLVNYIYITGMSEGEASEICKTAEHMGSMIPGFGCTTVYKPGYWTPLLEVSARNGYYL